MENFTQGNDPRKNIEKPKATFQMFDPSVNHLMVLTGEDKGSSVYFLDTPDKYLGGATYRPELPDDFVGDPAPEMEVE